MTCSVVERNEYVMDLNHNDTILLRYYCIHFGMRPFAFEIQSNSRYELKNPMYIRTIVVEFFLGF